MLNSIGSSQSALLNSPTQDQSTSTTSAAAVPPAAAIDILSLIFSQAITFILTVMPVSFVKVSNISSEGTAQSGTITVIELFEALFFSPHETVKNAVNNEIINNKTIFFIFVTPEFVMNIISKKYALLFVNILKKLI